MKRLLLLLACLAAAAPAVADDVKLAVAANFADVARRLAPVFEARSGHTLLISAGSSGKLTSQIENGAPFEVFLSADADRPIYLAAQGQAVADTRFTYAVGCLVLWSPEPGAVDAKGEVLKKGAFNRLAVANPKTAPYGLAAQQTLRTLGLYDTLAPKLVQGDSITQVWQFAASGNAEVAFVALSQVLALDDGKRGSYWLVPKEMHAPIAQDAILLRRGADRPAARAFLDFLRSAPARGVIEASGYLVTTP
jgi:molybdate transport system substrate-binding protein